MGASLMPAIHWKICWLEQALVGHIATLSGQEPWHVWLTLDDMLSDLAEPAAERLRWQAKPLLVGMDKNVW